MGFIDGGRIEGSSREEQSDDFTAAGGEEEGAGQCAEENRPHGVGETGGDGIMVAFGLSSGEGWQGGISHGDGKDADGKIDEAVRIIQSTDGGTSQIQRKTFVNQTVDLHDSCPDDAREDSQAQLFDLWCPPVWLEAETIATLLRGLC